MPIVVDVFPVTGMSCTACASGVEGIVASLIGVSGARVNFATHTLSVQYDSSLILPQSIQAAVERHGYGLVIDRKEIDPFKIRKTVYLKEVRKTIFAFLFAVPLMLIGMIYMHSILAAWVMFLLAIPLVFVVGFSFHRNAFFSLRTGRMGMDMLVSLSTLVAFFYSTYLLVYHGIIMHADHVLHVYFEPAGMIISFIILGKTIEEKAKFRAAVSLRKLIERQTTTAIIIQDGAEVEVPVQMLMPGDELWIKEHCTFPADGFLYDNALVDESFITGESIPIEKLSGEMVKAGSINMHGAVRIKATATGSQTFLSAMVQRIQDAQESRIPVQRQVDRISTIFVPTILVIAALTFFAWIFFSGEIHRAVFSTVAVLIIACPCAMGLATPTAIIAGIGRASQEGILIKNAEVLEKAGSIQTIVIDKTGTLTEGKISINELVVLKHPSDNNLSLSVFYSMVRQSTHPVSRALADYLQRIGVEVLSVDNYSQIPGKGIVASYNGTTYQTGNKLMFETSFHEMIEEQTKQWPGYVLLGTDKEILMAAVVSDTIKNEAAAAVQKLKDEGIDFVMATGDQENPSKIVAALTGIKKYYAGCLPEDKSKIVQRIRAEGRVVAVVGDGMNDAESMSYADVSIAMGSGTDVAREVADITIIRSDLRLLHTSIRISIKTLRVIRQNLFWAFFYNILAVPLAAGVFYPLTGWQLNPMIASAAMAFSSVSVVLNSIRLRTASL